MTPGHIPPLSSLSLGEIAINIPDEKLFTITSADSLVTFESNKHKAYTYNFSTSSIVAQIGINNTIAPGSQNAVILGGSNNTVSHNNVYILGSNISTVSANYTYVNNLSATNDIRAKTVIADSITDTQGGSLSKKKTFTVVGDGLSRQFTLNHNFNTYGLLIQVYEYDTKETVICYSKNVDLNNTLIDTGSTLNVGVTGYLVVIFG